MVEEIIEVLLDLTMKCRLCELKRLDGLDKCDDDDCKEFTRAVVKLARLKGQPGI